MKLAKLTLALLRHTLQFNAVTLHDKLTTYMLSCM